MKKFKIRIEDLEGKEVPVTSFDRPTESATSAIPLLFQSGCLTIKKFNPRSNLYTLAPPNNEVRIGLIDELSTYLMPTVADDKGTFIGKFAELLYYDRLGDGLHLMRSFIASIPYNHLQQNELSYHIVFYIISRLLLQHVESEVKSSAGRSDMILKAETHIYLFEFKFNGTLDKAMLQIDEKGYLVPYECDERKLVKVAVNFNDTIRTIDGWRIEREGGEMEEWFEE